MSITYSSTTDLIYAAVSDSTGVHVSEFAARAGGDVAPLRTIEGSATGFTGKIASGLAVDPVTGDLYVMVEGPRFAAAGAVEVFAPGASGNAAPLRTFTDSSNHFSLAQGLAFGPS
jgi:DNA-binding beta-propeller fold protein YncE